ncbi:MAG: VOC family protein [Acidobacteriaceae bacterium]
MSYQTVTPYLTMSDAAAAIDFYKQAFDAEEVSRHMAPDGKRLMHVHMRLLGSDLMFSDEFSDKMGGTPKTPQALGGSPVTLHLQVEDANAIWDKAVAAGATITMPLKDQFWGDRYGQLRDPFGHNWSVGQKIKDLSREEVEAGAKANF